MKTEREFLHDISTPLATALFLIDAISGPQNQIIPEKLDKLKMKLMELRQLLEDRRNEIKKDISS